MISDRPEPTPTEAAFDAAARRAHAASLDRLSPRVQAQLAQRRRAALKGEAPAGVRLWPMLTVGGSAALALTVGLMFLRTPADDAGRAPTQTAPQVADATPAPAPVATPPAPVPAQASTPASATVASAPTVHRDDVVTVDALPADWTAADFDAAQTAGDPGAMDESPDFYLWLAAQGDQSAAPESL
ncbi:MAG: hypothetical protein ACTHOH_03870 [Lysobacteraceae bacterium]